MATGTIVTFEEFERVEFGADDVELLRGEIIRMPPPVHDHDFICKRLFKKLDAAVEHLRELNPALTLGDVYMEKGYLLSTKPRSWLRPDVSLTQPNQAIDRYYLGAPLIAFEIVSDSDRARNIQEKIAAYLSCGSIEVWTFFPKKRQAELHHVSGDGRIETEVVRTPLLPGVEIPFSEIF
jgi:Uma2 family endonuclease